MNAPTYIHLKPAINQIKQVCDKATPYFFMVGAGISHPEVPVASEIMKHCREVAENYHRLQLIAALTEAGKPYDLALLVQGGHNDVALSSYVQERTIAYLVAHLKP